MRTVAFWLSLILIFTIPWENVILFGDNMATGARAVGLVVAAFWFFTIMVTGRFRRPNPLHVAVYVFMLWNIASIFWTADVSLTLDRVQTYLQLALMVFILWDLFATPAALRAGMQAYVLGAYVAIASTIVNYLSGANTAYGRYAATGFNANDLGIILAMGIPVAWHLALTEGKRKRVTLPRIVNYAFLPAATLAILLTASRGALFAAVPAFVYCVASLARFKTSARVLISVAIIGTVFILQPIVPQSSIERLATIGTSVVEADLGGRVDIWRQGIAVFSEQPLLGVGSGAFRAAVESGKASHNSFLSVLVEVGIVGLLLFAVILAMTVHQAIRQPKWDARLWLTVLMVWGIGSISVGWEHRKPTWLFLGLVVTSAALSIPRDKAVYDESFRQDDFEEEYSLA